VAVLIFAAPSVAKAQAQKVWRIGYLTFDAAEAANLTRAAFRERLQELGYVEGQNVEIEMRGAEGRVERFPALAAELVRLKVDVVVTGGDPATAAVQKATTSTPVVMIAASDPVSSGFVTSIARPGGNITGLTSQSQDLAGKTLQLLREAVPNLSRVAVLFDPVPGARRTVRERAFAAATRTKAGAVVILAHTFWSYRALIGELAVKRRLPTAGMVPELAEAGWLIGYGSKLPDQGRRAAELVDQILKGARPANLPVEQPTKFYLAINLKTAKAIGLTIPQPLLQRADQVVE
jgi:putative ABC transport system substrate-binding protein